MAPGLPDSDSDLQPTDGDRAAPLRVSHLRSLLLAVTGGRTFLGARWVRLLLAVTPAPRRPGLALRLVGLAAHHPRGQRPDRSAHRDRGAHDMFVRDVLEPYLAPEQDLLDVGCGPGYLARAVAGRVWSVEAVDLSRGVLACARVLNHAVNIDYRTPREFFGSGRRVDIAVSLTLATQLDDEDLSALLTSVWTSLRPGGCLVLRASVSGPAGGRPRQPTVRLAATPPVPPPPPAPPPPAGPAARPRGRYRPEHHPREAGHLVELVELAGFGDVRLQNLDGRPAAGQAPADTADSWLLVAIRRYEQAVFPRVPERVRQAAAQA
ncbi:class I SAM-dependent methyltransferase [Parafrankia elaeagni]|uniref:class I SAM-dependent methyltransferase n=1 Tax=Parafrankia elaeagni TaxID=222534 RepID=UPI00035EED1E|nr:class I SAM-dependent methyltransferase [Parafrankia elaeagni]